MTGAELIGPGVSLAKLLFDVAKSAGGAIPQAISDQAKAAAAAQLRVLQKYGHVTLLVYLVDDG